MELQTLLAYGAFASDKSSISRSAYNRLKRVWREVGFLVLCMLAMLARCRFKLWVSSIPTGHHQINCHVNCPKNKLDSDNVSLCRRLSLFWVISVKCCHCHCLLNLQIPDSVDCYLAAIQSMEQSIYQFCLISCIMRYLTANKDQERIGKYKVRLNNCQLVRWAR